MRQIFILTIFSILFLSCDNTASLLREADTVEITLYGRMDKRINHQYYKKAITGQQATRIVNFVSSESAPFYKCGYNGSLSFRRKGKVILEGAEFNIRKDCSHIVFIIDNELISKRIKPVGLRYLRELYKKHVKREHWLID